MKFDVEEDYELNKESKNGGSHLKTESYTLYIYFSLESSRKINK